MSLIPNSDADTQPSLLFPSQLPCLSSYDSYCSNQVAAKALLDHKKQDHRVQDFLQRCLESPFSRKLDLWNFLDIPRSRLVKYPLLLREILRHTPNDNPDQQHLEEAVSLPVYCSLPALLSRMARVGSVGTECMGPNNLGLFFSFGFFSLPVSSSSSIKQHVYMK